MAVRKVGSARIIREVGRGGMGVVYEAEQEDLGRKVAIKELPEELARNPQLAERFRREGRAHATLRHSAIPVVFDLVDKNDALYLVTEFVDGPDLGKVLKAGALPPDCVTVLGAVLADALQHVHTHQLLHRDLKPSNVMVTQDGEVKLMDFGIAKDQTVADLTQEGLLIGSPPYLAPELLTGHKADARSDIYSLGATLYELLAGERPFKGKENAELFANISKGKFIPLRKKVPGLPRVLCNAVERCLRVKPDQRWANAGDLSRALQTLGRWMIPDVDPRNRLVAMLVNRGFVPVDNVTVMDADMLQMTRMLDAPDVTPHWARPRRWPYVVLALATAAGAAVAGATGLIKLPL
jgi:serine/threonine-protein kinase